MLRLWNGNHHANTCWFVFIKFMPSFILLFFSIAGMIWKELFSFKWTCLSVIFLLHKILINFSFNNLSLSKCTESTCHCHERVQSVLYYIRFERYFKHWALFRELCFINLGQEYRPKIVNLRIKETKQIDNLMIHSKYKKII